MYHISCDIRQNGGRIEIHPEAKVEMETWLDIAADDAEIVIEKGVHIGRRSVIGSAKSVVIEEYVMTGPQCFITDTGHEFADISRPISWQGLVPGKGIRIGRGSWAGINSVIMANVGRNCIIAANAVVTHDVPDYTMVAGAPAICIKRYNLKKQLWEKIKPSSFQSAVSAVMRKLRSMTSSMD
jgi:acetyltransferase-like isoleucine patch superfamily enzyme